LTGDGVDDMFIGFIRNLLEMHRQVAWQHVATHSPSAGAGVARERLRRRLLYGTKWQSKQLLDLVVHSLFPTAGSPRMERKKLTEDDGACQPSFVATCHPLRGDRLWG
jgi:hypothetical protein